MRQGPRVIQKTVAAAGTPVQASATAIHAMRVDICAKFSNTQPVFFGGPDIAATKRKELQPNQSFTLEPGARRFIDISTIWIDATVNGEGVEIVYYTQV